MPLQPSQLVLASQSPRRRQLLAAAGYEFNVIAPHESAETDILARETPNEFVARLAYQKAASIARQVDAGVILGCDTIAECRGQLLGKPVDRDHARQMLLALRGQIHHVYSGVCLWQRPDDTTLVKTDVTKLRMAPITDQALEAYLDSNAWAGKAGAFGYQDRLGWIELVAGSESNVVGLPMELLANMFVELMSP